MCDEAARLAKIGRQEYDLIRIHDAPNCDDQTKFECDLELARYQVIRSEMALVRFSLISVNHFEENLKLDCPLAPLNT